MVRFPPNTTLRCQVALAPIRFPSPLHHLPNSSTFLARAERLLRASALWISWHISHRWVFRTHTRRFAVSPPGRARALLLEGTPPAPSFPSGPLMFHSSPFITLSLVSREGAYPFRSISFVVSTVYAAITLTLIRLNPRSSDPHFSPDHG